MRARIYYFVLFAIVSVSIQGSAQDIQPAPDEASQKEALATIKKILKNDYAKTKSEEKLALAKKLLAWFDGGNENAATRFVLLTESAANLWKGGDINAALATLDRLMTIFQADKPALMKALVVLDPGTRDPDAVKFAAGMKTLVDKPDDPAGNLNVGMYRCFLLSDWATGLPAMAKGSDTALKDLATKDLSNPADPKDQAAVGDGWFGLSERETNKTKKQALRERAKLWYDRAIPGSSGAGKGKMMLRVDDIAASTPPPPPVLLPATEAALSWLAKHQEEDGHWDSAKYGASNPVDTACTGFALLAFVRSGSTELGGTYQKNVRKAIDWLKANQAANGCVYAKTDAGGHRGIGYPHGIAGIALCEAAGAAKDPNTKLIAQKAVDYSTKIHQNAAGGFRYTEKSEGCISVSGWYFQQMKAAKMAGLAVPGQSFQLAIGFLDTLEKKENGVSVYTYQPGKDANKRRDMIGCATRLLFGAKKAEIQPSIEAAVALGGLPAWGANGDSVDLYYWYYGTLATSLVGGDVAKQWNDALKTTLISGQCKAGDDAGSWPIVGDFSGEWGRIGETAIAVNALIMGSR